MSYYINKETLEVITTTYGVRIHQNNFVEYPYDEYEPEMYELRSDSGDAIVVGQIKHIFRITESAREAITNLNTYYERYIGMFPQYDYISFVPYKDKYFEDGFAESMLMLKPYGCFNPSAERALIWYKEQKADVEKREAESRKNIEYTINNLAKRIEEAKMHLEELNK